MSMESAREREFEIVVWGATGFVGRLTAQYLLERYGTSLRWALGGRNRAKLENVRDAITAETGVDASGLPLVVGDAADATFMRAVAERTRVACTTVGPYALYGSELVAACAAAGTDYCDLTGEVFWMGRMIDAHQEEARASGARIVHTCGFDCIPAALLDNAYGANFRYDEAMLRGGGPVGFAKATGLATALRVGMAAMAIGPLRRAVASRLPAPRDGPSKQAREAGYWDVRLLAEHPTDPGNNLRARLTGDRDPGYGSTAKMLAESAVCLARDPLASQGGIHTPASAMGDTLLDRLRQHAGVTAKIEGR